MNRNLTCSKLRVRNGTLRKIKQYMLLPPCDSVLIDCHQFATKVVKEDIFRKEQKGINVRHLYL